MNGPRRASLLCPPAADQLGNLANLSGCGEDPRLSPAAASQCVPITGDPGTVWTRLTEHLQQGASLRLPFMLLGDLK